MSFVIDAAFVRERLYGSGGTRLSRAVRDSIVMLSNRQLEDLIAEVMGNPRHQVHAGLDALARSVAELHRKNERRLRSQRAVVDCLAEIMPGTPSEVVSSDTVSVGRLRDDELAEMSIVWDEYSGDTVELRAPDPHGPQRNITDRLEVVVVHDPLQTAYRARKFYLTQIAPDKAVLRAVTVQGTDYEHAVDAANDHGGSTAAVVEHLLARTSGSEPVRDEDYLHVDDLATAPHQLHAVIHDGVQYWLHINHQQHLYTLYRPLVDYRGGV